MAKGKLVWKRAAKAKGLAAIGAGNDKRPWYCYKDGQLIMALYNNNQHWHQEGNGNYQVTFHGKKSITFKKEFTPDQIEEAKKWAESTRWGIIMAEDEKSVLWPHKQRLNW